MPNANASSRCREVPPLRLASVLSRFAEATFPGSRLQGVWTVAAQLDPSDGGRTADPLGRSSAPRSPTMCLTVHTRCSPIVQIKRICCRQQSALSCTVYSMPVATLRLRLAIRPTLVVRSVLAWHSLPRSAPAINNQAALVGPQETQRRTDGGQLQCGIRRICATHDQ